MRPCLHPFIHLARRLHLRDKTCWKTTCARIGRGRGSAVKLARLPSTPSATTTRPAPLARPRCSFAQLEALEFSPTLPPPSSFTTDTFQSMAQ